jgi:hypothetical protein
LFKTIEAMRQFRQRVYRCFGKSADAAFEVVDAIAASPNARSADAFGTLEYAGYRIWTLDHTPFPRVEAPTVSDRGFVHGTQGQIVGHQYSLLGRVMFEQGAWVGVTDCERIPTASTPVAIGAMQIAQLRKNSQYKHIVTADTEYASREIIAQNAPNIALLVRLRSNRVVYCAAPVQPRGRRGCRPVRGRKVKLSDVTWRSRCS